MRLLVISGRLADAGSRGLAVDLANPRTLNRYAYVLGNPLGYVDPSGMDTIATGVCTADYAGCPSPPTPVVGTPTVPDEITAGEQYYINTVVRPGFLGIPPVLVNGGLPTGSTGATIYFGSVGNWLSTNMIGVSSFTMSSASLAISFGGIEGASAQNGGSPWYKNSCVTDALEPGALSVGIDAIGLIPEAGGVARMIGHGGRVSRNRSRSDRVQNR